MHAIQHTILLALLLAIPATGGAQVSFAPYAAGDTLRYSLCAGEEEFLQSKQGTAETSYLWQRIENGKAVTLPYAGRTYTYTGLNRPDTLVCEVITTTVNASNNLMASGDFETCPPDFDSDYQYAFTWDAARGCAFNGSNFYDICPDAYRNNIYAITANANTFWRDYQVRQPHGGQYFALFDAGREGYAWKAETQNGNPDLKLQKDSTYLFSYWAAHPNGAQYSNSPAELQFVLILRNGTQKADTVDLGTPHKLYQGTEKDNRWHKVEVQWTNTLRDCDDVVIGVYDRNRDAGVGNDFCLDDIMFQNATSVSTTVIHRTMFVISPDDCHTCTPAAEAALVDTTVCYDTPFPIVWYGLTFSRPDASGVSQKQTTLPSQVYPECDSLVLTYRIRQTAQPQTDSVSLSLCRNELPYQWAWLPQPVTEAGIYRYTETTQQGCDSVRHILSLSITPSVAQYKKWEDVIFIPDSAGRYASYQWYHDALPIDGATEQFYHAPAGLSGSYHCVMQTTDGIAEQSCTEDFDAVPRSADGNAGDAPVRTAVARRTMWISPLFRVVITTYSDHTIQAEKQCVIRY